MKIPDGNTKAFISYVSLLYKKQKISLGTRDYLIRQAYVKMLERNVEAEISGLINH